jgi:hypothetical protein
MLHYIPLVLRMGHILMSYIARPRTRGGLDDEEGDRHSRAALRRQITMTIDDRLDSCWCQVSVPATTKCRMKRRHM